MSETQPTRPPAPSPVAATSEADLVKRINDTLAHIERVTRETVPRAIDLGAMLIKAKADYGAHGKWGQWLKDNCKQVSERTAQLYMKLAEGRAKIEAELAKRDPAAVADLIADLSLRGALQLLEGGSVESESGAGKGTAGKGKGGTKGKGEGNHSDAYDGVQKRLIEKLKKLEPEQAEAAVNETIKRLKEAVAAMKAKAYDEVKAAA